MNTMKIHPSDNVAVNIETGHKIALVDIVAGENIIKYGFPIGHAICDIRKGEQVHVHNLKTNLGEKLTYVYEPGKDSHPVASQMVSMGAFGKNNLLHDSSFSQNATIQAYIRENGDIGIRNDIWIVNTVGCVNKISQKLSELTGALSFPHPFGCSQLGGDHKTTQFILKGLVEHPNAGGVLVLGLGCENNNLSAFREMLGEVDKRRVKFLNAQDVTDEIAEGVRLIHELQAYADGFQRQPVPISRLKVGLKCGGSDGFSGITANPLIGQFSDCLIATGGSTVLTEVPEMFGAETILMNRCVNRDIFDKTVKLVNDFKDYYNRHNQVIYENPSPGNKAGGITTLEEKSLGCTQKGGTASVVDVLSYGDKVNKSGLNLLNGPGNDMVAVTNLVAAGCHLLLFSTGRGTPLGAPVPTVKISSNSALMERKPEWIDFDAGRMLQSEEEKENCKAELLTYVMDVANGTQTKNEKHGYREISIFKDGVVL